jgi:hypothetical protein
MMPDWDLEQIRQSLEELQRLGFIEVVGIKPDGEWLYGATKLGLDFVKDGADIFEKIQSINKKNDV